MNVDDINTIGVLGAGTMGHGIAEVAALAGYDVRLRDISEDLVQNGYRQIEWSVGKLVEQGQLTDRAASDVLDRIEVFVEMNAAVTDTDFIIEAVPERMEIKADVYEEAGEYAAEHTILVTNTSSLSITDLAAETDRPDKFCGMHFFNPPVRMDLIEVIAGDHTAPETLDLTESLATAFGKTPVRVRKDSPGFIVNRILLPMLNEAAWIVDTGEATIAEVDSTATFEAGLPMGAFELADYVGIDVIYDVLTYVHEELGDAYEPCPLIVEKAEAGLLGKKTDSGFYEYDDGGVQIPTNAGSASLKRRLLAVMANEVAILVDDDVADLEAIDTALTLGARFPAGPARLADDEGLDLLVETLDGLAETTNAARYQVCDYLRERAEAGGFYESTTTDDGSFESIRIEYPGDHIGHVILDRPERLNTITETMLDEVAEAIDRLDADDDVRAILLTGSGDRAFSAGADIQTMAAGGGDPLAAIALSHKGQLAFGRLESCTTPVVAGIDGYCLGGGMELATAADLRISSERSTFGQPELNLGLLPGWGGTQRLRHIVGDGRAKEILLTADHYDAETMERYGFLNFVVPNEAFDEEARKLTTNLAQGPPIAQGFVKRAMYAGRTDTDAGLEIESYAFGHLWTTDDLMEGVTAFMGDRDPEFVGK